MRAPSPHFKSAGRRLFRNAGVPVPEGAEDVHTLADVERAVLDILVRRPDTAGVVIKHDDSGAATTSSPWPSPITRTS